MTGPDSSIPVSLASPDLFRDLSTDLLRQGKSIRFRAPGRSMYPTIKENDVIVVEPIEPPAISIGDIILYRQGRSVVAHRVVRITKTQLPPPCTLNGEHASKDTCHLPARLMAGESLLSRHSFLLRDDTWGIRDETVTSEQILGKVVAVERGGRTVNPYSAKTKLRRIIHSMASRIKRCIL